MFFVPPTRKVTKESLVQNSSDITENLMNISRMMSQQVKQSEETISTLGKDFFFLPFPLQPSSIILTNLKKAKKKKVLLLGFSKTPK